VYQLKRYSNSHYSIPGKVFLLGEYAVLAGLPAVVATLGPRFEMKVGPGDGVAAANGSPVQRLMYWANERMPFNEPFSFEVHDPYEGRGGLGASTAEFAMVYFELCQRNDSLPRTWQGVWKLYRELMEDGLGAVPPSGADLVAQWQGGVVFFDPSDGHCQDVWPMLDWAGVLIFSATQQPGRKVKTHEHLVELSQRGLLKSGSGWLKSLEECLITGISGIREQKPQSLGEAMDQYASVLAGEGLELERTTEDRLALRSIPGVLGVKGTGALQADGIIVIVDTQDAETRNVIRAAVLAEAQRRGLVLVSEGIPCQMGIGCG